MTINWTRIAVKLHNDGRRAFEVGRMAEAVGLFREALETLDQAARPALDAMVHFGLAEAETELGEYGHALRHATRAIRINERLRNHEGIDACRRLIARADYLRGHAEMSKEERRELELIFEFGIRPVQHRLRTLRRPPRVGIVWWIGRIPEDRSAVPHRRWFLDRERLVDDPRDARPRRTVVHLGFQPLQRVARARRMEVMEILGPEDRLGRVLWLRRRGRMFWITREALLSV